MPPKGRKGRGLASTAGVLRQCLIALAALGVVVTAVELAMLRHWNGLVQLVPWFILAVIAVAIVLICGDSSRSRVRMVQVLVVVVFPSAAFGIFEHTLANYHAGPLDFRYSARWATMSGASRWWAAFTETVGPSPALAPLVLAWSALCLLFATIDHPAVRPRADEEAVSVRG